MFTLSPYLKSYIHKTYDTKVEIKTLDEFLNFKNHQQGLVHNNIFRNICVKYNSEFNAIRLMKECLRLGVDINDYQGYEEPVVFATLHHAKNVLFLFKNGAYSPEYKEFCKNNPNRNFMVNTIKAFNADYNSHQPNKTKIKFQDRIKVLDFLYSKGEFNPCHITKENFTLLQVTLHKEPILWLLNNGCDPYFKNTLGINAIEHHQSRGHEELVAILKGHLAQGEYKNIVEKVHHKKLNRINDEKTVKNSIKPKKML